MDLNLSDCSNDITGLSKRSNQPEPAGGANIVPSVRQAPGLIRGYWAGWPGQRSHSFVVFEDQTSAEQFAANVRGNKQGQAESGVGVMDLSVVPISAQT